MLTYEIKQNYPIIIAVHKDKLYGRYEVVNECVSMYAKQGPDPEIKWKNDGLLLWEDTQ